MIWTCFECRQLMPCIKALQREIGTLKENQGQMMDMLQKITKNFEAEERQRIKAEEELAAVKSQLSDLAKLTNERLCTHERTTTTSIVSHHQAPPTAPPLRNLLLGTSLLRNVDQAKLDNWEIKAKSGATIDEIHKELIDIPESQTYNEIVMVCGSIDIESKEAAATIQDYQALITSASMISKKITISSILPRTDKTLSEKAKVVNGMLKDLCTKEGYDFVENDPSFHLMNGEVNDAFLTHDGLHLTKRGVDSLLRNCRVLQHGSAFTPTRYPDQDKSNKLLFRGHKSPLSNFYPIEMKTHGKQFKSAEAAYQFIKAESVGDHTAAQRIMQAKTGLQAMRIAANVTTNDEWQHKKFAVMEKIIKDKLRVCDSARKALQDSGSKTIVEDTTHEFWGRGTAGQGKNMLGKIWMDYRKLLQSDPNFAKSSTSFQDRQVSRPSRSNSHDRKWATRSSQPRCYKCGEPGHVVGFCRKNDPVTCWACSRIGHKQKHCEYFKKQQWTNRGYY